MSNLSGDVLLLVYWGQRELRGLCADGVPGGCAQERALHSGDRSGQWHVHARHPKARRHVSGCRQVPACAWTAFSHLKRQVPYSQMQMVQAVRDEQICSSRILESAARSPLLGGLFFRLLLKNTERCLHTAASTNFSGLRALIRIIKNVHHTYSTTL